MLFWLFKTEPEDFSWNDMIKCQVTTWDNVRNYQAQNYMKKMKKGDLAFFYHTGKEKCIIGIIEIYKESYYNNDKFSVIDVKTYCELNRKIYLHEIKNNNSLQNMTILKQPRLSISPITQHEWEIILKISRTTL
ncbi:EVE domain-containing protein [Candidatus Neoehrlichia procyonis]|uniref:EVE domain protein n=1 Tax=Candidatus Neoehrlichia procyonis str. RAC413 TaxID=1359163 RepID=A0A0F3NMW0_9RICK|nr:EVE domain-containing protein [Candidatus Neoehrlichia lotoris]KJV69403.1 EVE domain protein [Candidatus Neoehrlichia lotoris str. RAC413]